MKTIFDVAELAGVSKSTVSRVINNSGSIKESTRRRVEEAMEQLNYAPSYLAQGIRTRKTKTIALMVPESSNLFYNELLYGVEEIALQHEYMIMLCNCGIDPARTQQYTKWLCQRNVDGLIYCFYKDSTATDALYRLAEEMPIVFVDNPLLNRSDLSNISSDGLRDTAEIVRILKEKGAERVAYIGLEEIHNATYRYMGYQAGMVACGYPERKDLVYFVNFDQVGKVSHFELGAQAAEHLMKQPEPPDAIVACTDMLAVGAMRYLQDHGIRVPQDVKVVGYDNIHLSSMVNPGLSTMAQPIERISQEVFSILFKKMQGDNSYNRTVLLKSEFLQRGST